MSTETFMFFNITSQTLEVSNTFKGTFTSQSMELARSELF